MIIQDTISLLQSTQSISREVKIVNAILPTTYIHYTNYTFIQNVLAVLNIYASSNKIINLFMDTLILT